MMEDKTRGLDAADVAPRPERKTEEKPAAGKRDQEAPNFSNRTDGGRAIPTEDLNSANDE